MHPGQRWVYEEEQRRRRAAEIERERIGRQLADVTNEWTPEFVGNVAKRLFVPDEVSDFLGGIFDTNRAYNLASTTPDSRHIPPLDPLFLDPVYGGTYSSDPLADTARRLAGNTFDPSFAPAPVQTFAPWTPGDGNAKGMLSFAPPPRERLVDEDPTLTLFTGQTAPPTPPPTPAPVPGAEDALPTYDLNAVIKNSIISDGTGKPSPVEPPKEGEPPKEPPKEGEPPKEQTEEERLALTTEDEKYMAEVGISFDEKTGRTHSGKVKGVLYGGNAKEMLSHYRDARASGYPGFAELWEDLGFTPEEAIGRFNQWKLKRYREGVQDWDVLEIGGQKARVSEETGSLGQRLSPGGGDAQVQYDRYREMLAAGYPNAEEFWALHPTVAEANFNRWEAEQGEETVTTAGVRVDGGGGSEGGGGGEGGEDQGKRPDDSGYNELLEAYREQAEQADRNAANLEALQAAYNDAQIRIQSMQTGTAALGQFLNNPTATFTSMFVDPRNAGQAVPVTPGLSSLLRQQGVVPTSLGARANAPIEGILPEQVTPSLFQDVVNTLTSRDLANLSQPGSPVLPNLLAFGQLAGINPRAALQSRMAQLPMQSSMTGSLFGSTIT